MKNLTIFFYEWKHFVRNPFKTIAVLLFVIASLYGLHNGASLHKKQSKEISKIEQKVKEERQTNIDIFKSGKTSPEDKSWINLDEPNWSIWLSWIYSYKKPSPAMVYSIGQSEQFGFYKKVNYWSSPFDSDLAKEISNPERLQTGTLDYTFAFLFLMPLVLIILLFNLKSAETEQGFMPLIEVQNASKNSWLLSRITFYFVMIIAITFCLIFYGAMLTNVFKVAQSIIPQMIFYSIVYILFWFVLFYFILQKGKNIIGNTLLMTGVYLLFTFIIPGVVHQYLSIVKPTNLMTEFIDAEREDGQKIFDLPDDIFQENLNKLFPEITKSKVFNDAEKSKSARGESYSAVINKLKKESTKPILKDSEEKNNIIKSSFIFNPVSYFINKFNSISQTHFVDYLQYRNSIQNLIDKQNNVLINDTWNDVKVDEKKYKAYYKMFKF